MTALPLSRLFACDRPPGTIVALRGGEAISLERFRADVAGAAARLACCRRAALYCRDSYAFATGFFALLHVGAQVVLPANGQPGTLRSLSDEFDRLVGDAVLDGPAGECDLSPLDAERLTIEFFTSGSTGTPKRVAKSLAMLEREVAALDGQWGTVVGQGSVQATVTHQHLYGLIFKLAWPLAAGRPFAAEVHELWETLLPSLPAGATVISSPAHLGRLTGITPLCEGARPAAIFSAGAPLPPAAAACAEAVLGRRPIEIFGSTETGAIATRRPERHDTPWQLLPGNEIRTDAEGLLSLRSPYGGDGGWVATADLAEAVPGGFRFLGRTDQVIKIEGKRVSLIEVEQALSRLPLVERVALALVPGEPPRLCAAVVPSVTGWERLAELGAFRFSRLLRRGLAETQEPAGMPRLWRFVDELPQRAMGKCRQADILALFGDAS